MRYKETGVDSQTRTFGALSSASQTVWYIHKLRVHSQNRLFEASRYFVAHFAHVWLRHNIRKRNIPLSGMFLFYIVDSQTRTFGALLSASQTVWYIHKLRVHSQNRLFEASRYFVAHFAHVWLRHKKKKGNFPLQAGLLGMFPFFFFLSVCYILKIARASSSLPASWRRFSDETSRLFIVSLMPCAEFIVLVVEASFCSEIDARLCTTS